MGLKVIKSAKDAEKKQTSRKITVEMLEQAKIDGERELYDFKEAFEEFIDRTGNLIVTKPFTKLLSEVLVPTYIDETISPLLKGDVFLAEKVPNYTEIRGDMIKELITSYQMDKIKAADQKDKKNDNNEDEE